MFEGGTNVFQCQFKKILVIKESPLSAAACHELRRFLFRHTSSLFAGLEVLPYSFTSFACGISPLSTGEQTKAKQVRNQPFNQNDIKGRIYMFTNRENVIKQLKAYPLLQKRTNLLRYEQSHTAQVSQVEVIGALALARTLRDRSTQTRHLSYQTMRITATFREEQERMNYISIMDIGEELGTLEAHIAKLEFYISQQKTDQSEVVCKYYFEWKACPELQQELMVSRSTLIKRRDSGIDALVAMGTYWETLCKEFRLDITAWLGTPKTRQLNQKTYKNGVKRPRLHETGKRGRRLFCGDTIMAFR